MINKDRNNEVLLKKDFLEYNTMVSKDGQIVLNIRQKIPQNFESFINLIVSHNKRNHIEILDNITVLLKISPKKYIFFHKTLLDDAVDISIKDGSIRFQNFMSLPLKLAYQIICQWF